MKTLNNLLLITGFAFGINNYASAQSDTIFSSKTSSIIEEKTKKDGAILEKKEYVIEKSSEEKNGKVLLETEKRYSFKEKEIGRPSDPKEPKNIINRKQIDKFLDYIVIFLRVLKCIWKP